MLTRRLFDLRPWPIFDDLFDWGFTPLLRRLETMTPESFTTVMPEARVHTDNGTYRFEVVAPGLDADEDLTVEVDGTVLTVEGGREESRDGRVTSSRFRRRWDLGYELDPATVTATYEAGVLTVEVPRPDAAETEAHRIPITTAEPKSLAAPEEAEAAEAAQEKEVATA
ncbi:MAG TPA: Hsp20/alpha crystallin family protein [Acidimicrobiia bacterium]|nr:Hsp20/alpha crystallin family protein [Acidimicrobiia bacterium]